MFSLKNTAAKGGGRIGVPGPLGPGTPNGSAPTPLNPLIRSSMWICRWRSYRLCHGPTQTLPGGAGYCGCCTAGHLKHVEMPVRDCSP